jgi:hypothetical protein
VMVLIINKFGFVTRNIFSFVTPSIKS